MWTFLDMNSFFAACEQQDRPDLRGLPIAIAPMLTDNTCCIAVSYEAKACGVKTGTGIVEARTLCPNILIVEARPRLYRETHKRIVAAVEHVAPVHEILSIDEMTIAPWANEETLVDCLRLGQSVQDVIRYEAGEWLSCSVGIAPNAFLAKVASDLQKPRGLSVISPGDIPHKLCGMALNDWPGIAKGMKRRFADHGVETTRQMYDLSMPEMRDVFGGLVGERWHRLIRGEQVEMPRVRKWQVGHSNVLAPEFRTKRGAWSVGCRLLEKAAERLRSEELCASRVHASVTSFDGEGWSRFIKLTPTDRTYRFLEALRMIWQDSIKKPCHVSVALQNVAPSRDVTLGLFPGDAIASHRIDSVVDRINQRFGRGALTTAASLASKDILAHERIPFGKPTELR